MRELIMEHIDRRTLITSLAANFAALSAGFADTLIVSQLLGPDAVAASGLAAPFYSLAALIHGCLSTGFKSAATRRIVGGDTEGLVRVYSQTVQLALLFSAAAGLLLAFFSGGAAWLLGARGDSASLAGATAQYLTGLAAGLPALVLTYVLSVAMQLNNRHGPVQLSSLLGLAVDVALDWAAIRGGLGMLGVGLASSAASCVSLAVLLAHLRRHRGTLRFRPVPFRPGEVLEILRFGSERALSRALNLVKSLIINPFVLFVGGNAAMTAYSIRNSVISYAAIPGYAIGDSIGVAADIASSIRSESELRAAGRLAHRHALAFYLPIGLALFLFADPLAACYLPGALPSATALLSFALRMAALKLLTETLLNARVCFLQAVGSLRSASILRYLTTIGLVIPCMLLMGWLFGAYGLLASFTAADYLAVLGVWGFHVLRIKSPRVLPEDYLGIGGSGGIRPQDVIDLTLRDGRDAALTGEQVQLFCKGHKLSPERSAHAALCAEEGGRLLLAASRSAGKRGASEVKIHVLIQEGSLRIHFRFLCGGVSLADAIARQREAHDSFWDVTLPETILHGMSEEVRYFPGTGADSLLITL